MLAITAASVVGRPAYAASLNDGGRSSAARQPAADTADAAAVATLERFHRALAAGDRAGALALLAPDALIVESGEVQTRDEYAAHHLPADIAFARAIPGERQVVRAEQRGDAVWVTATSSTRGTFNGRAVDSAGAELAVLVRTPTGWQIGAIHWSSHRRAR